MRRRCWSVRYLFGFRCFTDVVDNFLEVLFGRSCHVCRWLNALVREREREHRCLYGGNYPWRLCGIFRISHNLRFLVTSRGQSWSTNWKTRVEVSTRTANHESSGRHFPDNFRSLAIVPYCVKRGIYLAIKIGYELAPDTRNRHLTAKDSRCLTWVYSWFLILHKCTWPYRSLLDFICVCLLLLDFISCDMLLRDI